MKKRVVLSLASLLVGLFILPNVLTEYWLLQIISRAMILGIVALSLTFLASYLGVVSFAQAMMAGVAGYFVAYFGPNSVGIGIEMPVAFYTPGALVCSTLAGVCVGWIARRSVGIYAIMITLAVSFAFFYLTRQNYEIFNGWTGFSGVVAPTFFGLDLSDAHTFYRLCIVSAFFAVWVVNLFVLSPMGLVVQGTRDAARRVRALGIGTTPAILVAYGLSGFIAGIAGILGVWFQQRISSFSVGIGFTIDILIVAVIGGLKYPVGAFLGAVVFVLLDTFAIDLIDRERFNLLIGAILLLIVMIAPDGLMGTLRAGIDRFRIGKRELETTNEQA